MTKQGIIESVSIQGTSIFVVVRYLGEVKKDLMGNPVNCGRTLAGIPSYTPEKLATIAEVMLPLNASAALQITDPKILVGSKCVVHLDPESEFPLGVSLMSENDSRVISRRQMWDIRNTNPDGIVDDRTRDSIEKNGTASKSVFNDIYKESYDPEFHKGMVGTYSDIQDPIRTSVRDSGDTIDFSQKQAIKNVTGVEGYRTLRQKDCYLPTTVFTGRT